MSKQVLSYKSTGTTKENTRSYKFTTHP